MDFLVRAAQLILSLSILVSLHEFGHYITARWFKTRVEKFYLFFNPWFSLYKKQIGETEWGIGWLPLGGYVKIAGMIDESMDKEQMAQPAQPWEFRSKPAWQRLIIMTGGVIVNVILGFIIYIAVLAVWGEQKCDYSKIQNGLSVHPYMEQYGFRQGDNILKIDGKKYNHLPGQIGTEIMIFGYKTITVKHQDESIETIKLPEDIGDKMFANFADKTFELRTYISRIDSVIVNGNAKKSKKIFKGDKILAVNGTEITFMDELTSILYRNRNKQVAITLRDTNSLIKQVQVKVDVKGVIGISQISKPTNDLPKNIYYNQDYSIGQAFTHGFSKGYKTIYMNIAQFKYVATKRGATSVGGFGSIGKMFSPVWDWESFWMLTAFLSFMLAVMNMLPIPALDGGHVMFLLYEIITGRAPSQRFMEIAQYIGFAILLTLILYANGKDLLGLFS